MFKEEFKYIRETKKDLRKFGISVGLVLLLISFILFYFDKPSFPYFLAIGLGLFVSGIFFPVVLKPVNKIWMSFAVVLGYFMSRLILTILFYFVLTPIGLIAKLFGKKFLNLDFKTDNITYWEKRSSTEKTKIDYERQF